MLRTVIGRRLDLCAYLTRMEFERRFAGTMGGKLWVFLSPLMTIVVIWLALDYGLGMRASLGPAYGMSLVVGLCAWLFVSDAINSSTGSITGSPHLVKKVVFPVILLPVSNVLAAFIVHLLLLAVVFGLLTFQIGNISWNLLALPFWSGCLLLFAAMMAILAAGLNVLFRDVGAVAPNIL
ncbi:MAG: ABC transporter permease, partial [Bosea sp. (in: a-proteobacteria)]